MKGRIFHGDDEMRMSKRWREQICAKSYNLRYGKSEKWG